MICISKSKLLMLLMTLFVFINTLLLSSTVILAQDSLDVNDVLIPSVFVIVEELTSNDKTILIQSARPGTIVDKNSRLRVRFDKKILQRGINLHVTQEKWQQLLTSNEYKELRDRLNQTTNDIQKNELQKLITATEDQVLLEMPGYMISISASISPKQGHTFDLAVEGYTTVKVEQMIGNKSAETRTVVTTMERRPYRAIAQLQINKPLEPGVLIIQDDIVDAFVNLPAQELAEGDRLNVTVTNHLGSHPRQSNWVGEIHDLGIRIKQEPSLMLIKRFKNSDSSKTEVENKFKPAPGSSFLFKFTTRNRVWNFLDPSIGINGSFVDFRTDKDLEIGIGPVLSILNGILQLNIGWNLNVDSDRGYWSVGLGFLDIANRVSGLVKK